MSCAVSVIFESYNSLSKNYQLINHCQDNTAINGWILTICVCVLSSINRLMLAVFSLVFKSDIY